MNVVKIKKGKEISLSRKHPWVFSGAIVQLPYQIKNGEIVKIIDFKNETMGIGYYQSGGSIAIRILAFEDIPIDLSYWQRTIDNAADYRYSLGLPEKDLTDSYRLIHGEGDGVPGLIIDIYKNIAVIQCHTTGIYLQCENIAQAIKNRFSASIDTIYLRSKESVAYPEQDEQVDKFLLGSSSVTTIHENGVLFEINVITGQKTGFFLDQRINRHLLGYFAKDKTILNCYCYTGGFSLYSLKNGAKSVTSVDISQTAIDLLEKNLNLNHFEGEHHSVCANVLSYLSEYTTAVYDIVITDPPAFAKSLHKRHNAVQAYKRLNILALQKVKKGGLLFTFSCSQVVGTQLFYDTIVAAGMESGRKIRVTHSLGQGPDHPVNLFHPEGHYLKGLVLYVD
jgi:23S rRNA (cytosine1962-C5)-methyltransferase